MLCLWTLSHGQNLANWSLTSNTSPDATATNVNASDFSRGAGISSITTDADGATADAWPTEDEPGAVDYYEVCVDADNGYALEVDSLYFTEQRSNDGIAYYEVRVSTDDFQTETLLLRDTVPDNTLARDTALSKLGLTACDGQQVCFRWYAFGSEAYAGTWSLSDVRVAGTAPAECTPPTQQLGDILLDAANSTSADFTWEHQTGGHFIVVARELGQPEYLPCSGISFSASGNFGNGTDFGQGNYVVQSVSTGSNMSGSFTITGLESGQAYEITAFAYDPTGFCYRKSDALRLDFMTTCNGPSPSASLQGHPGGEIAYLSWSEPLCYAEVLLLGSEQPITDDLTSIDGSAYMPDTVFAMGTATASNMDLSAGVYPLYQGTSTQAAITGLTNSTTYYFRLYTRYAGAWVAGPEVSLAPKDTCSNGDYLFLSELHYRNTGEDVDEGVEVTGEAGLDLSNYQIDFYGGGAYIETLHLSGTITDQINGVGAEWFARPGMSDAGAVCLYNKVSGRIVETYALRDWGALEGGVADGIEPPIVERSELDNSPVNQSIQRNGDGACPTANSVWGGPFESSRGVINTSGAPLPISLVDFSAQRAGGQVRLRWQTATELNNDYMAVEHSVDGRSFTEIGRVSGAGTTQEPQQYTLTHTEPAAGVNYYRLRQVDFDGQFEYFGPVSVRLPGSTAVLQLYPTATRNQLTLDFTNPKRQAGAFLIFNTLGQLQRRIPHDGGSTRMPVDVSTLPAGQYTLLWQSKRQPLVAKRFTKL
jgi:hypothetical protein